jgi:DNA-damage-inducible protein J
MKEMNMVETNTIIHVQCPTELKEQAEAILEELGIPIPVAYELFYRQIIAYRGLPFEVCLPNRTTIKAMEAAREGKGKQYPSVEAMFADLEV